MSQVFRAYSLLDVKSIDAEQRTFSGIASTPTPDRMKDVVEPLGLKFAPEMPLLLYHKGDQPVGIARFGKPTKAGVPFTASIPDVIEQGTLRERVNEAWQSVKYRLLRGVSIGFTPLNDAIEVLKSGGIRFLESEVLELSLVAIPANAEATILNVKHFDTGLGASAIQPAIASPPAGVSASVVHLARKGATSMKKTSAERIKDLETSIQAKSVELNTLQEKVRDEGRTKDESERETFDTLETEINSLVKELEDERRTEKLMIKSAVPAAGHTLEAAKVSRDGGSPVITVRDNLPPGIGFARAVMCQVAAHLGHYNVLEVAKARYPDHQALHNFLQVKAAVPAGTTTNTQWASPLVYAQNLTSEFIEYLRPSTIIGKFGTDGIPSLRRVPFNVRFVGQTTGGGAWWVKEGQPKPLTSYGFEATTLLYTKVAAIAVISQELARFSSPSAEALVRDALRDSIVERLDIDFIDPAQAAVAATNPASITNGLVALNSAGTSADNVRTDLTNLLSTFLEGNVNPTSLVLIMPNTLALALSILTNSLGQPEFPDMTMTGGRVKGIPVITSQYAANASGSGNLVIAMNASDIFLADDGEVTVDASREASLEMLDNPTNNSTTPTPTTSVSMYQTNSIALKAERFINWAKRRTNAVVYMDDVNWGSVGSPP